MNADLTRAAEVVELTLPLADVPERHYRQYHLQVALNAEQADAMKRLGEGLAECGVRLHTGARVVGLPNTVKWLAEEIARTRRANQADAARPTKPEEASERGGQRKR